MSIHLQSILKDFKMCHKKMKEKKHLTDLEKGKALAWLEARLKQKDIAQRLSTIERLARKRRKKL